MKIETRKHQQDRIIEMLRAQRERHVDLHNHHTDRMESMMDASIELIHLGHIRDAKAHNKSIKHKARLAEIQAKIVKSIDRWVTEIISKGLTTDRATDVLYFYNSIKH